MTRVVYVTGLGRSGSTLLDRLLARLPGVTAHGELASVWTRGLARNAHCACGARFFDCPFWREVGREAFGDWSLIDLDEVERDRLAVDRLRHLPALVRTASDLPPAPLLRRRDLLTRLYDALAGVAGAEVVVDSSKWLSTALLLARAPMLDVRFVHLVRDPRGVACSWETRVDRPDATAGESAQLHQYDSVRVAARYLAYNALIAATPLLRPRALLRYEDLVASPSEALERVGRLAGLDRIDTSFLGDGTVEVSAGHTLGGNPIRLATGPVTLRLDERWRTSLPAARRAAVVSLTFPLMVAYGYLGSSSSRSRPPASAA